MTYDKTDEALAPIATPSAMPIGYYQYMGESDPETKYKRWIKGEMVYATDFANDCAYFIRSGSDNWTLAAEEFCQKFEFVPDGKELRHQQLQDMMTAVTEMQNEAENIGAALLNFHPHVDAGKFVGGFTSTALTTSENSPQAALKTVAQMRNSISKIQAGIQAKMDGIQVIMNEQLAMINKKVRELNSYVHKAEELIWTINLYMGKDEEIHVLQQGAPAPATEVLSLRQLVLYMDEECAVDADTSGIDAMNIAKFDTWLTSNLAHLNQVLPEQKGMVAIKVRRKRKEYGNAHTNAEMDELNRKTYFLCRNGENIYRLWVDYDTGSTMLPTEQSFLGHFIKRKYDFETGEVSEVRLEPGTDAYMKAVESANAVQRHFLRFGLILQGLLDRTTIFQPMIKHIQVNKPEHYGKYIQVIRDAELGLPDGRERFTDWLARINGELEPGARVIGFFDRLRAQYDSDRKANPRLSPEKAALPRNEDIYTIVGRRKGGFYFQYDRNKAGEIKYRFSWDRDAEEYKVKASCVIYPEDTFILNIDAATVEEMEFYLQCRLDREEYMDMFPLLKRAIAIKKNEAETEAPFVQLLVGQIVNTYSVDFETAQDMIPELVEWWKFKNRIHRALTSDNKKALLMIVAEFGIRLHEQRRRTKLRQNGMYQRVLNRITHYPNMSKVLLVAHKQGNEYTVLLKANNENVFVHEQIWKWREDNTAQTEVRKWRTVGNRYKRWEIIYQAPEFEHWKINASRWEYLSDPEIENFSNTCVSYLQGMNIGRRYTREGETVVYDAHPTAMVYNPESRKLTIYGWTRGPVIPQEDIISRNFKEPETFGVDFAWKRGVDRIPSIVEYPDRYNLVYTTSGIRETKHRYFNCDGYPEHRTNGAVLLRKWQENIDAMDEFDLQLAEYHEAVKPLSQRVNRASRAVLEAYKQRKEKEAYNKFLTEFGDPDLWEGHKKTLKAMDYPKSHELEFLLRRLVERGHNIYGRTIGELFIIFKVEAERPGEPDKEGYRPIKPKELVLDDDIFNIVVEVE